MDFERYQQLEPHVYPFWIILGISGCLTVFILFLFQLPLHFQMNAQFKQAEYAFQTLQYANAYESYQKLLEQFPACRHIRLRVAESLFCMKDKAKHILAFQELEGFTLKSNEWEELQRYMPTEYVQYFDKRVKMS